MSRQTGHTKKVHKVSEFRSVRTVQIRRSVSVLIVAIFSARGAVQRTGRGRENVDTVRIMQNEVTTILTM